MTELLTDVLTAAQMRVVEQAAIGSGSVTGLELMERAGCGVLDAIFEEWPDLAKSPHSALVLCGPGNNGGDGFVVARLLRQRGWDVAAYLYGDPDALPPDASVNLAQWRDLGDVMPLTRDFDLAAQTPVLIVDALFGTGLTRPIRDLGACFQSLRESRRHAPVPAPDLPPVRAPLVVSVDIPSGLCADSGRILQADEAGEAVVTGDLTVTFHRMKPGHLLGQGPSLCGKVVVCDIGLREVAGRDQPARLLCRPPRAALSKHAGHKFDHGHALILSGGFGRTGAARLAAQGALRIGAGLVTLGVPGAAQMEVASQITALMMRRIENGTTLRALLDDARINALCLGPGSGLGRDIARTRDLVSAACGVRAPRAMVLDADALTAFADAPETLFRMLHRTCVLTPHAGEFARLFPDLAERLAARAQSGPAWSRLDAVRAAARRAGCTVLLKGADTVIADPDGRCHINAAVGERAAPWLATAGSGDVLAGFITGLLARGSAPMQAAGTAAWLHVECARSFGPGLIAADLPEVLPRVFQALEL